MTSRLDRLFLLLDNGSTPLTRKAAALQLGEVQKLHPHELNNLLIKVRNYLHSSSWDTRIAASQAVEAIITNVPLWFPNGITVKKEEDTVEKIDLTNECKMMFDRYDVNTVIKCGHNLLASEMKNYDDTDLISVKPTESVLDRNDKIAQMRKSINQKLGLAYVENITNDFISNSDLEVGNNEINYMNTNGNNDNNLIDDLITKVTGRKLKRTLSKPKFTYPVSGLNSTENSNDSSMLNNKKIKLEPKEEPSESLVNEDEDTQDCNDWPLAWFCDELMSDLLNAQWEVRHGSAIGLREIVKLQGRCGGRSKTALSNQQDKLNQLWLEDLSLRLLTVLALDKFGDYVSDQVVAPVRETCAQVLGLIIKFLSVEGVISVLRILLQLLQCSEWEARHGGMLGVKYMLAVRRDMIEKLLPEVFEPVFNGLKDPEDDVSAVAAAALVPVKDDLMRLMPEKVPLVVSFLWEALLVLDDLSSSTGDLLMLLSSLLTFKGLESDKQHSILEYDNKELVNLIPRLWPFLFHSLSSVRKSVLESLLILSEKSSDTWLSSSILSDALRLLFQRSLIENHNSILDLLYKVWLRLISKASYECLIDSTRNYMTGWIFLMMHSQKIPIDPKLSPVWLEIKQNFTLQNSIKNRHGHQDISMSGHYFIGGFDCLGDSVEEQERCIIRARYQCARLIGALAFNLTEDVNNLDPYDSFASILLEHLESKSAIHRMCSAWIIREWKMAQIDKYDEPPPSWMENNNLNEKSEIMEIKNDDNEMIKTANKPLLKLHKSLSDRCIGMLEEQILFDEISNYFSRVQNNFRDLLSFLRNNKLTFKEDGLAGRSIYIVNQINTVVNDVDSRLLKELKIKLSASKKSSAKLKSMIERIEEIIFSIRKSINELNHFSNVLSIGVKSSLASALVAWQFLPERYSPIIRPLMDSIKYEENEQLQRASASSLVRLLNIFCELTYQNSTTPTQKIICNLISYLCSDKNFTPEITLISTLNDHDYQNKSNVQYGILALDNMQKNAERNTLLRRSNSLNLKNKGNSGDVENTTSTGLINNAGNTNINIDQEKIGEIQRRGATITLSEMCRYFANSLPNQLPSLWKYITNISLETQLPPSFNENSLEKCKSLIQSLQVFEIIGPYLHHKLHSYLVSSYDFLCQCLQSPFITIRHMASRCFGMLSSIMSNSTMNTILTKVLDMLEASDCELKRQGAVEAIYFVIDRLSLKIVPYIVLLIVPMLGRMSDQNESVRLLSTHCFAQLVQLMPLDNENNQQNQNQYLLNKKKNEDSCGESLLNGPITSYKDAINSCQIEFSKELLARKQNERHFLEQLMNSKKLDDYKMPIPVKAELRQYQQDGLNWLSFLNKYKLHGIVADEMGLGKTLQAICILASDHYYMKQNFFNEKSANPPLLSLVICPPTLIGHWMYEVEKFVDATYLNPIMYTGPPLERAKIKVKIQYAVKMLTKNLTNNYNLIIASYDLVRNDIDFFNKISWNYCILDEGHVIKNGKTKLARTIKTLKANHRLILTGTPIQNNVLELWSLFDFLMPGFLGTERQFTSRYSKPIFASRDAKSSSKEQEVGILAMENLHRQVLPFILRRMKEDVLKDLPPKIMQDYYCELSPLQAQLYEDFSKSRTKQTLKNNLDTEVKEITSSSNNYHKRYDVSKSHIFQSLQYLRKVCNHPKLVLSPLHPNYDAIMNKLKMENTALSDICHAAKLVALKQLLQDCGIGIQTENEQTEPVVNQHRALIFCQLKSMLDIVEKDLLNTHMKSVSYLRLDGDVPSANRYSVIHRFNNDPSIDVLLLTIQVGGLGLNLTGADTVIFVEHDWNPMKDLQAMDRAHRIGQKKVVNVYRLLTTGTLEEKIMGLQKFKLTIANTVISSENSCLDSMATDQLLDLFELSPAAKDKNENNNEKASSTLSDTGTGQVSMRMMLDSLPDLWDTTQYENEYDLNNFLQSLSNI